MYYVYQLENKMTGKFLQTNYNQLNNFNRNSLDISDRINGDITKSNESRGP